MPGHSPFRWIVPTAVAVLLGTFAATTWWALESGGVAVIETRTLDGSIRSTHVWYAESDGELWLEAGTPENAWFRDVQRNPELTFTAADRSQRFLAEPSDDPSGHARIRSLLRDKYGFRDVWVGFLVDTSRSVAVRLVAADSRGAE
jgi:hypothetical protein